MTSKKGAQIDDKKGRGLPKQRHGERRAPDLVIQRKRN